MYTDTDTIIFIAPTEPLGNRFVMDCMGHVIRRDYQLHTVLRDWDAVDEQLAAETVQVVILATQTYRAYAAARAGRVRAEVAKDPDLSTVAILARRRSDRADRSADELLDAGEPQGRTAEIDTTKVVPIHPRAGRAAQLVEDAARRYGFAPADPRRGSAGY